MEALPVILLIVIIIGVIACKYFTEELRDNIRISSALNPLKSRWTKPKAPVAAPKNAPQPQPKAAPDDASEQQETSAPNSEDGPEPSAAAGSLLPDDACRPADPALYEIKKELLKQGLASEKAGESEEAYRFYREAADAGNPLAMFMIGNLYCYKNYRAVVHPAYLELAMMPWSKPTPMVPDLTTAFPWFLRSARAGYPGAMSNVGVLLYYGKGTEQNTDASRAWLTKAAEFGSDHAVKALKDLFRIDLTEPIPDGEYDALLERFCRAVESDDPQARSLYYSLALGNDSQLCRLGYRLAVGRYHVCDAYGGFPCPAKSNGRSCAPVTHIRTGWATILIVNRDAFPEKEPVIAVGCIGRAYPVKNAVRDALVLCEPTELGGWFHETVAARCLKLTDCAEPCDDIEHGLSYACTTLEEIERKLAPREDEAVIIEDGEKEYCAIISHITEGKAVSLLRYTVGGSNQGDAVTRIPKVSPMGEKESRYSYI